MSSLGYAIAFMICAHDGQACDMVAIRASRFATIAQCRATIGDALRVAARVHAAGAGMTASCQSLDDLCGRQSVSLPRSIARQLSLVDHITRIRLETHVGNSAAIDGALAMLCRKPPESVC